MQVKADGIRVVRFLRRHTVFAEPVILTGTKKAPVGAWFSALRTRRLRP